MKKHLASVRKGWQGENLARYILSNFSFISHPSTIADDLGADFFCTLFNTVRRGNKSYLVPKASFAIQIKSNRRTFDITGKREYLENLEIPFFVGVCNQKMQNLEFYSGEYLIPFFADILKAKRIKVKLCETVDCNSNYYIRKDKEFTLRFPKCCTIGSNRDSFKKEIENLSEACRKISRNISRRNNKHYIFFDSISNKYIVFPDKVGKSIDLKIYKIFYELAYILEKGYIKNNLEKYKKIKNLLSNIVTLK